MSCTKPPAGQAVQPQLFAGQAWRFGAHGLHLPGGRGVLLEFAQRHPMD